LTAVAAGGSTVVAGGTDGTLFSSPDGKSWTSRRAALNDSTHSMAYGNSTFVSVGSPGAATSLGGYRLLTSTDGITWTQVGPSGSMGSLSSVVYTSGEGFVAVGSDGSGSTPTGLVVSSPDGVTWTQDVDASVPTAGLSAVTYGDGLFVAGGPQGSLYTSPDGTVWTPQSSPDPNADFSLLAFGNGLFVAVDTLSGGDTATSPDGVHWTLHVLSSLLVPVGETGGETDLAFGEGELMTSTQQTSTDGVTWTQYPPFPIEQISGLFYTALGWVGGGAEESFWIHQG
jgi:hypothetical protein